MVLCILLRLYVVKMLFFVKKVSKFVIKLLFVIIKIEIIIVMFLFFNK